VAPGTVTLTDGHMPVVDADGAAAAGRAGTLLDARAYERYTGEHEPIDPRAGHIPGARSAPTSENLDADGHFLPAEELGRRFRHLGVPEDDHAVVYCGSGVTAAHQVAAMSSLGLNAGLYPGSFSQWSADAHRPVATSPETHEQEAPGREAAGGEATGPEADRTGTARSLATRRSSVPDTDMLVLGIETACDETGDALVRDYDLLADVTATSMSALARFGGIVPEVATTDHPEDF